MAEGAAEEASAQVVRPQAPPKLLQLPHQSRVKKPRPRLKRPKQRNPPCSKRKTTTTPLVDRKDWIFQPQSNRSLHRQ